MKLTLGQQFWPVRPGRPLIGVEGHCLYMTLLSDMKFRLRVQVKMPIHAALLPALGFDHVFDPGRS